jgi:mannose-6-phosphate isomerase-like protein (cupin superfamily)
MAEITAFKSYQTGEPPKIPKPDKPVDPMIVTVQDGVPVVYPGCHGVGVRVVHPVNPNAPAKNMGLVMFYVPPHVVLQPGSHETEETYVILEGSGRMTFANFQRDVKKGDFVYLPSWCEHGIENTGNETLVVLIATSPPNP